MVSCSRFVCWVVFVVYFEVCKLDNYLNVGIRRGFEFFDEIFVIFLVCLDSKLVFFNDFIEVFGCMVDFVFDFWCEFEFNKLRFNG